MCVQTHSSGACSKPLVTVNQKHELTLESVPEGPVIRRDQVAAAGAARKPPFTAAKISEFVLDQRPQNLMAGYNARPLELSPPPLSLYFSGFRQFRRTMAIATDSFDFDNQKNAEFIASAAQFVTTSSRVYRFEDERQKELQNLNLLNKEGRQGGFWRRWDLGKMKPDGSFYILVQRLGISGQLDVPLSMEELECEIGTGDCDPVHQAMCAYISFWSQAEYRFIWERSCCPGLLIGVAGETMRVWGGIFADRFYFERLAVLELGPCPAAPGANEPRSDLSRGIREVAKILYAIDEFLDHARTHFLSIAQLESSDMSTSSSSLNANSEQRHSRIHTPTPQGSTLTRALPAHQIFPDWLSYTSHDGQLIEILYDQRLVTDDHTKTVFVVRTKPAGALEFSGQKILKFSHKYSQLVHETLEAIGCAPKLEHCAFDRDLQMYTILMEYIPDAEVTEVGGITDLHRTKLIGAITAVHNNNLVLGDLRLANLLISGDHLYLIDFEWSGKEGEVRYPEDINANLDWADGVAGMAKITAQHDEYRLHRILGGHSDVRSL
ncbi:hypothetical protein K438DRAFT_1659099 [Mycena galopus ATCC 62051]|nr:hypothetical protein K438DRAFT_1659099 [Mycena galopus ATCC 62051]